MTDDVFSVIIDAFSKVIEKMRDFVAVSITLDGVTYSLSLWALSVSFLVFWLIIRALQRFFGVVPID